MIVLLPVQNGVHAVKGDRLIVVERDETQLRLRMDFGTYEATYVLKGDEQSIGQAWREFLENYDLRYYVLDLTRLKRAPAPEAVATGD